MAIDIFLAMLHMNLGLYIYSGFLLPFILLFIVYFMIFAIFDLNLVQKISSLSILETSNNHNVNLVLKRINTI